MHGACEREHRRPANTSPTSFFRLEQELLVLRTHPLVAGSIIVLGVFIAACSSSSDDGATTAKAETNPTCLDGVKDGSETGIDCGGSCVSGCNAAGVADGSPKPRRGRRVGHRHGDGRREGRRRNGRGLRRRRREVRRGQGLQGRRRLHRRLQLRWYLRRRAELLPPPRWRYLRRRRGRPGRRQERELLPDAPRPGLHGCGASGQVGLPRQVRDHDGPRSGVGREARRREQRQTRT